MSTEASIALILLIVPMFLCVLPILALSGAMVFGMHKLRGGLKTVFPRAQHATERMVQVTRQACDKVAQPFIAAQARYAGARTNARTARDRFSRRAAP